MLALTRSRSVRVLVVLALAMTFAACTGATGSGLASPPASLAAIASAPPTPLPSMSPEPSASVEPTDDEVEDEDDEESPTPKPTPVAGCGTGESAFHQHTGEVNRLLTFGDADMELATAGIAMRDGSYRADDSIPYYVGLTKDEPRVRVGKGDRVSLVGDGMTFTDLAVAFAPWSDLGFETDPPSLVGSPTEGTTVIAADGTVTIVAPDAPGDYMVQLSVDWQTSCLKGDGSAYGGSR